MAFDFDAIVIGSGFGAAVAVTELVFQKQIRHVLMLERGVWWYTPERPLPDYVVKKKEPVQYWPRPDHRRGIIDLLSVVRTNNAFVEGVRDIADQPQPLYRYNSFDEIDILTASGVGGGSLIYSNVSIEPYLDAATNGYPVMEDWPLQMTPQDYAKARQWMADNRGKPANVATKFPMPKEIYNDANHPDRLAQLLRDNPALYLGRSRWLKDASEKLGPQFDRIHDWAPLDLQVAEYDGKKPADVGKFAYCERQGRCFLGCLPGARHTLNKTYVSPNPNLLNGDNAPVEMRSLADVDHIEPLAGGGYRVFYDDLHFGDFDDSRSRSVTAPVVIVAAGVLGTAGVMLRSREHLEMSDMLGRRFSTNGDAAGFVTYPTPFQYGIYPTRGPINTSHVMYRDGKLFVNVEDAGVPPMLATSVKRAIEVFANAGDRDPFFRQMQALWQLAVPTTFESPDPSDPHSFETEHEALQNTFFFNLMGRDQARGRFALGNSGELTLDFEGGPLSSDPVYRKIDEIMAAMAAAMSGQYVRFPFWGSSGFLDNTWSPRRKTITVHPLGGCAIGNTSTDGVVDQLGRVFSTASGGDTVHSGLYVADGSIMPGPLAVNPTLTIVAMAKRIAENIPAVMATAGGH